MLMQALHLVAIGMCIIGNNKIRIQWKYNLKTQVTIKVLTIFNGLIIIYGD